MEQNLTIKRLPGELFEEVNRLSGIRDGPIRFLDPSGHLGFNIFDEKEDQPVESRAPWD